MPGLFLYSILMRAGAPLLLRIRARKGKENPARLGERAGQSGRPRPAGPIIWIHAASVGEAQSALILINDILARAPQAHLLVTTGTVTSAQLMGKRLPPRAMHQFYPLDHPAWVKNFLDHWRPDLVLWMESELWPHMLLEIKKRGIPALLINARISERSLRRWAVLRATAQNILSAFTQILAQTEQDARNFLSLGASNVTPCDNLKYAAEPLPFIEADLQALQAAINGRPLLLYASTHDGEEDLACRLHKKLKKEIPDLLTIIVPRHPNRRDQILSLCRDHGLSIRLRGDSHALPQQGDNIYIADTLGELGLFYRLAPLCCIGRSFSHDGGGGHNPIEAAQLGCAVMTGPHVQNLAQIFDDMDRAGALIRLHDEEDFFIKLKNLLLDSKALDNQRDKARKFITEKSQVRARIINHIAPYLDAISKNTRAA